MGPLLAGGLLLAAAQPAIAQSGDPNPIAAGGLDLAVSQISVGGANPVLTLAVRNTSDSECQLPAIPDGSLTITALELDGRAVLPILGSRNYIDGIGSEIAESLQPVAPAGTVEVSLAKPYGSRPALQSVSYSLSGLPMATVWPIDAAGHYRLTALYSVPDLGERTDGVCTGTSLLHVEFDGQGPAASQMLIIAAVVALIVAIVVVIALFLLLRRRRSRQAVLGLAPPPPPPPPPAPPPPAFVVALLVGALVGTSLAVPPSTRAVIAVANNPEMAAVVNGCLAKFRAPGGDPAGIVARLDGSPKTVRIQEAEVRKPSTDTNDPDGAKRGVPVDSTVNFNPRSSFNFTDGIAYEHCSALYHELSHGLDLATGKDTSAVCGNTKIPIVEVRATLIENQWRASHGLLPRKEYDGKILPPSEADCKPKPGNRKKRGVECDDDCGGSNGDPHLATYDGSYYSFQAVGEFILSRTADRSFEVQARQAAYPGSRTVSVNSALAFGVAGDRVAIYAGALGDRASETALRVVINGVETPITGQFSLPSGGSIEAIEGEHGMSYVVSWPDGSAAWVNPTGRWGARIEIDPADAIRGQLQGLLGNADDFKLNDFVTRDGRAVDSIRTREQLYDVLGDSWRVPQAESLFDYGAGQSTATFTVADYPAEVIEVDDLPDQDLLRELCGDAGIVTEEFLLQCMLDLGVTGQWDFGDGAAEAEATNRPAAGGAAPVPTPSGPQPSASIGVVEGVVQLAGQAAAPDGTLYVSVALDGDRYEVQQIEPSSGEVITSVEAKGMGAVAYAGGTVWVAAFDGKRGFGGATGCSISGLDPATLTVNVTVDASCGVYAPTFAGAGDSIWYVDTSVVDTAGIGARLTRADPQTGAATESIALPFNGGYLASSERAIFYFDFASEQPIYRFHPGDTAWQSIGSHPFAAFAGDGGWTQDMGVAAFYTSDGAPDLTIPIDGFMVDGGDRGAYVATSDENFVDVLALYPADRTAPLQLASAPVKPSDPTRHFSYSSAQVAKYDGGLVAVWNDISGSGALLITQRIPLP